MPQTNGIGKFSSEAQESSNRSNLALPSPEAAREKPEETQSDLSLALAEIDAPQSTWNHLNHVMQNAILAQQQAVAAMDSNTSEHKQGMKMRDQTQDSHVKEYQYHSMDSTPANTGSGKGKTIRKKDQPGPAEPSPAEKASKQPRRNTKKRSFTVATITAKKTSDPSNTNQEQPPLDPEKSETAKQTPNSSRIKRIKVKKHPLDPEASIMSEETHKERPKLNSSNESTGQTSKVVSSPTHYGALLGGPQALPRTPSIEPLSSTDEPDQYSLENMKSPSTSHLPTPPSSGGTEQERRIVEEALDQQTATDANTLEEKASEDSEKKEKGESEPQPIQRDPALSTEAPEIRKTERKKTRAEKAQMRKTKRQREEMDMYAPNIDPSADLKNDVPLPTPFQLSKKICKITSSSYVEKKLGQVFPKIGISPPKSMRVDWPEDAPKDHKNEMESWMRKEQKWAKSGVQTKHRAPWSFKPAPKDIKGVERWIGSYGQPLQRPGYVSEYSKASKKVLKLQETFEKFSGAVRIDEKDPKRFLQNLRAFVAAEDDDCDSGGETYDERMRRIKSWPPNDTIEYDDRIDSTDAASIKEPTTAMKRGDVSGASVPSERFHFNEGANRVLSGDCVRKAVEEKYDADLAALTLMELSVVSRVHHPLSDDEPSHTGQTYFPLDFDQPSCCSGCCPECCSEWCSECRSE